MLRLRAAAGIVFQAFNGQGRFDKKYDKLRVIANLFPEHMHLVLPKDGKLGAIKDLKGKRVGIFQAGSGTQISALELLKIYGIAIRRQCCSCCRERPGARSCKRR